MNGGDTLTLGTTFISDTSSTSYGGVDIKFARHKLLQATAVEWPGHTGGRAVAPVAVGVEGIHRRDQGPSRRKIGSTGSRPRALAVRYVLLRLTLLGQGIFMER
jgi:hypothetical protein